MTDNLSIAIHDLFYYSDSVKKTQMLNLPIKSISQTDN